MSSFRFISGFALALLVSEAVAQIGPYPGGAYPGGGYPAGGNPGGGYPGGPGIPMPRRGRQKSTSKEENSQQLTTVSGTLRALNEKQVVVQAQDTRIINLKLSAKTKFIKD